MKRTATTPIVSVPKHPTQRTLATLECALNHLNASCGPKTRFRIGAMIHTASCGTPEGFEIFDNWSAKGQATYPGRATLAKLWGQYGRYQGRRLGWGTLIPLVEGKGIPWATVRAEAEGKHQP